VISINPEQRNDDGGRGRDRRRGGFEARRRWPEGEPAAAVEAKTGGVKNSKHGGSDRRENRWRETLR
jgi:hypothetical protein